MISFELSPEQKELQAKARAFAEQEMAPVARHYDETGEFPIQIMKKAFENGLMNDNIPKEYGGVGHTCLDLALVTEELLSLIHI